METFSQYEEAARRTASNFNPENVMLNAALGLCGEAGEVADHLKKATFQGHKLDPDKIIEEMGDILWYIAQGSQALGVPMQEIARRNIEKLSKRYPQGFEVNRSVNREE